MVLADSEQTQTQNKRRGGVLGELGMGAAAQDYNVPNHDAALGGGHKEPAAVEIGGGQQRG